MKKAAGICTAYAGLATPAAKSKVAQSFALEKLCGFSDTQDYTLS